MILLVDIINSRKFIFIWINKNKTKCDSEESNDRASNNHNLFKISPPILSVSTAALGYLVSKFVGKWLCIRDRWKQHFKEQLIVFIQSDMQGLACIKAKRKKGKRKKAGWHNAYASLVPCTYLKAILAEWISLRRGVYHKRNVTTTNKLGSWYAICDC